jgi:hypothetical protein
LTLTLNGTQPGSNYTILSQAALTASNWNAAGLVTGAQNQSWTAVQVPLTGSVWFVRAQYYPNSGGGGTNSGGGGTNSGTASYGTNLWLNSGSVSKGMASLAVMNSAQDILYEIQAKTNLLQPDWMSLGFVYGSELTNWTAMSVFAGNSGNLFLRIRSWVDTYNSGIPDWWWLQYFGQITNVDAYAADPAGDGYSNLQKFQMGLNPTNYYNPNGPPGFYGYLDPTGTNAFIAWSPAPGPVANYLIQRGVLNTNTGNYSYSQIGTVSSTATLFKDVGAITNANAQNNLYNLEAVYPGGSLSATDTWQVSWYVDYASSGPPYGPPMPGNVYAYADSTGTNVLLSWIPAQGAATNDIILRGIFNSTNNTYNYTPIARLNTNTTSLEIFGALTNDNNWTDIYEIEAVYPGGGLSSPASSYGGWPIVLSINVGSSDGPAAPTNFYGYTDSTGTNTILTWNPASGAVTNYLIYGGTFDYSTYSLIFHRIGKVNAGTNAYEVVGSIDSNGNNLYYYYSVAAVYPGGGLSQAAFWYSRYGAPAPGALSAYLDSTGTNVVLAWTAAQGAVTGYIIQRSDYSGGSYYQIGEVNSNTTSFVDVDEVDNAPYGIDVVSYEVQATYPNGGLSPAVTATVSTNLPTPSSLSATVDSTGTNVLLSWSPAVGTVLNYIILQGIYNPATGNYSYSQIGEVNASTTSFEDAGAITGNNSYRNNYEVEAVYAGGNLSQPDFSSLSQSSTPLTYNINITAQLVRNQTGRWQVMFSGLPASAQLIQLTWTDVNWNSTLQNIPVGSLTDGIYYIPDTDVVNHLGDSLSVQVTETNGTESVGIQAGVLPNDAPYFVDGHQHLKQNLNFLLRSASRYRPFGVFIDGRLNQSATNFEEFSFLHRDYDLYGNPAVKLDNLWPFTENYSFANYLVDTTRIDNPYGSTNFNFTNNFAASIPAPPILNVNPLCTLQPGFLPVQPFYAVYAIEITNFDYRGLEWGVTLQDTQAVASLQSGLNNVFGLPYQAGVEIDFTCAPGWGFPNTWLCPGFPIDYQSLPPGSSVTAQGPMDLDYYVGAYASQCPAPTLNIVNYYFAPLVNPNGNPASLPSVSQQLFPLPIDDTFNVTNKTPVMVGSVGQPMIIGTWAKYSIQGSSPAKYAYLGQYFTNNAYLLGTNGVITTNIAGILSPYGEFFPTQAGQAALVTMPDIDPPYQQGTGVVQIISIDADANHDGVMDFSSAGPDQTSSSRPLHFWVADDNNTYDFSGDGVPGRLNNTADGQNYSYFDGNRMPVYRVLGRRHLEDFFPVYLNIGSLFQSNALSAGISTTDTNWQFVLSQTDGALRFAYTDLTPTNYMNFLRDTNESGKLVNALLTTITPNGITLSNSFMGGIATNNQGIILVEAWESTTQPLILTIYHGTNQIAQTSLYLSISGVEQMFRHKNLMLNGTGPADRLTDASVPNEPDTVDKNFVFLHGYNVNTNEARGVAADMFKRMYWSGSHAKFWAVTWEGADTKGGWPFYSLFTPNYHTNVVNAFLTAPNLANFIATLTNNGPVVVAAHSLGNMVTLSAINDWNAPISQYFMMDAALAMEAIDPNASMNTNMIYSSSYSPWRNYSSNFWASYWYQLFPTNDARSTLTWNNRVGNLRNIDVYNFYSSGEEVLREYDPNPPDSVLSAIVTELLDAWPGGVPFGGYAWAWQEKGKGVCSQNWFLGSNHEGWQLNDTLSSGYVYFVNGLRTNIPPSWAVAAPPSQLLVTNAFFNMSVDGNMFTTSSSGSTYAQTNRNRILSDAIPALTLPVGANPIPKFVPIGHNADMMVLENGWPQSRLQNAHELNNWWHSDFHQMAYTFTYKLFDQFVTTGNLK